MIGGVRLAAPLIRANNMISRIDLHRGRAGRRLKGARLYCRSGGLLPIRPIALITVIIATLGYILGYHEGDYRSHTPYPTCQYALVLCDHQSHTMYTCIRSCIWAVQTRGRINRLRNSFSSSKANRLNLLDGGGFSA